MTEPLSTPAAQGTVAPCPFCGSTGKMIACMGNWLPGGYEPDGRRIACSAEGCFIAGKPFYGEGMEEAAIAWWNRRAPSPEALPASGMEAVAMAWKAVCEEPGIETCARGDEAAKAWNRLCQLLDPMVAALTSAPAPEDRDDG